MHNKLRISLRGPLKIATSDDVDLTPKGAKAQAIIALLAIAPDNRRARVWLQDKLWSDRGREQGAASLRQALSEIRKSLGVHADLLVSDRRIVSIDLGIVEIDNSGERELLEGIDVRDQEFENWLTIERSTAAGGNGSLVHTSGILEAEPLRNRALVCIYRQEDGTDIERLLNDVHISTLAKSLSEQLGLLTFEANEIAPGPNDLVIRSRSQFDGKQFHIHAACYRGAGRMQLWSGHRSIEARGAPPLDDIALSQLTNEAVDAVIYALNAGRSDTMATDHQELPELGIAVGDAVRKIFSMDPDKLALAENQLKALGQGTPNGTVLAWRVFLRVVQLMERLPGTGEETVEEVRDLCRRAIQTDPMNSFVLSMVAYAKLVVTDDVAEGFEYARRAIAINATNPFAWLADCTSRLYLGRLDEAHQSMLRACRIGQLSPYKFWWDTGAALTATAAGDLPLAERLADRASTFSTGFRPPLRYLIALKLRMGDHEGAYEDLLRLRELEPSFQPEQLVDDPSYPSATLRRAETIGLAELRSLK